MDVAFLASGAEVFVTEARSRPHKPYITVLLPNGDWVCACASTAACQHVENAEKFRADQGHQKRVAKVLGSPRLHLLPDGRGR